MSEFDIRQQMTEKEQDNALRPLRFADFAGQSKVVSNLRIFVEAAKLRGESLDHVLLFEPPGLGKTTLSNIIANELGVGFKITSGLCSTSPATWQDCSPASSRTMSFSSMRYTASRPS